MIIETKSYLSLGNQNLNLGILNIDMRNDLCVVAIYDKQNIYVLHILRTHCLVVLWRVLRHRKASAIRSWIQNSSILYLPRGPLA